MNDAASKKLLKLKVLLLRQIDASEKRCNRKTTKDKENHCHSLYCDLSSD